MNWGGDDGDDGWRSQRTPFLHVQFSLACAGIGETSGFREEVSECVSGFACNCEGSPRTQLAMVGNAKSKCEKVPQVLRSRARLAENSRRRGSSQREELEGFRAWT
jgi:hypothetical protein